MMDSAVYVVDDDMDVRESLAWLLDSAQLPVQTFSTAQSFLAHIEAQGLAPLSCLVADLRLPGMTGLDLQKRLLELGADLPVLIVTGYGEVSTAVRAMKHGAVDFIEKPFNDELLLARVRETLAAQRRRMEASEAETALRDRFGRLTQREQQVMRLVVQGKLNKQVAAELDLSPKTVEVHRSHAMAKMEAGSLAELVRMAVALERVEPGLTGETS